MRDLGRTSALRSPRQCPRIDEELSYADSQRFIGAFSAPPRFTLSEAACYAITARTIHTAITKPIMTFTAAASQ